MTDLSFTKDGGFSYFEPRTAQSLSDIERWICEGRYSPIVYEGGKRAEKNFKYADMIALDFDGDLSVKEAKVAFAKYKYIIAPTKSHQREKHGVVADRFRVVLLLKERITDLKTYKSTAAELLKRFPEADRACKDGARYFEPSLSVAAHNFVGRHVEPVAPKDTPVATLSATPLAGKGDLSRATLEFLSFGAPDGEWNPRLHKATVDLQEQGYSLTEAKALLAKPTGHLDANDYKTIEAQYAREVRYKPREIPKFRFEPLGDIIKRKPKVEWLVDGLLSKGGLSMIAGQPKCGKSTLTRQLAVSVMKGDKFLGRACKQGKIMYLALEEQEAMLYEQFSKLGVNKDEDRILIHVGKINTSNPSDLLMDAATTINPGLIIVDTLLLFDRFSVNDYNEVNESLENLRAVARQTGAHIAAVHHQNKNREGGAESIMGSNAFHGAVDNAIMMTRPYQAEEGTRILNTSQRGGKPFNGQPVEFDYETQTYRLGGGKSAF